MKEFKFYRCSKCGNIVFMAIDSGVVPSCCGTSMELLEPKTRDSGTEKHLPVCEWLDKEGCNILQVKVGEEPHPMEKEHHICFIAVITTKGIQIRNVSGKDCSCVKFCCKKKHAIAIFSYCNIHGMWVKKL